jgi:hypothetical protein
MGLEAFKSEDSNSSSSSISTRKKLKNVNLEREFYVDQAATDPMSLINASRYTDETSSKAIVQMLDEIINDEIGEWDWTEEQIEEIEEAREEIVEQHL